MESAGLVSGKYYTDFAPTKSAQAIRRASYQLYCCDDMLIMGRLGNGYFASVFLVHHRPTDQLMAMKLTKEASTHLREIELLNKLNHKNVIKLLGSCVIGARFASLTELANGGNLCGLLSARQVDLPWHTRISLALDIANGLHHLHSHSLIHRDLSSANILIHVLFPDLRSPPDDLERPSISPLPSQPRSPSFMRCDSTAMSTVVTPLHLTGSGLVQPNGFLSQPRRHSPADGLDRMGDVRPYVSNVDSPEGTQNGDTLPGMDDLLINPSRFFSTPVISPIWKQPVWPSLCAHSRTSPRYVAVVADLGLCLDLSRPFPEPMSLVGNPYYIAPECLSETASYSFAADIFAFGLLLCELTTRLVNDGSQIPRTQDFGLDCAHLPVPPDCPPWFLQAAVDACTVDHKKRPKLGALISCLSKNSNHDNDHSVNIDNKLSSVDVLQH